LCSRDGSTIFSFAVSGSGKYLLILSLIYTTKYFESSLESSQFLPGQWSTSLLNFTTTVLNFCGLGLYKATNKQTKSKTVTAFGPWWTTLV